MDQYSLLLDLIVVAAGIYLLYTWFRLKKEGKLFENQLLVPKDSKITDCLDEEGFIAYFQPKLLILGVICTVIGAICAVEGQTGFFSGLFPTVEKMPVIINLGGNGISFAVLVWYMVCWTKARKEYWV